MVRGEDKGRQGHVGWRRRLDKRTNKEERGIYRSVRGRTSEVKKTPMRAELGNSRRKK